VLTKDPMLEGLSVE
jgi:colicin import membrane protein